MSYKQKKYIIAGAGVLIFFVLVWAWSCIFLFLLFNHDAGYYLLCAERIYEGLKPYLDFKIHYPPVLSQRVMSGYLICLFLIKAG